VAVWLALFRGINVGGNRILPMKDLVGLFEGDGFENVRSYIQSGNVVFRGASGTAAALGKRIAALVLKSRGFEPKVLVLRAPELAAAAAANPFPHVESDHKALHLIFLSAAPKAPDLEALNQLKAASERFVLKGRVLYLHAPDGLADSRLAARAERLLGVDATARNWRTVSRLLEMSAERN
jgi:uncharacterized protein (DUF1697 family)